jgi:hypothetical protein
MTFDKPEHKAFILELLHSDNITVGIKFAAVVVELQIAATNAEVKPKPDAE